MAKEWCTRKRTYLQHPDIIYLGTQLYDSLAGLAEPLAEIIDTALDEKMRELVDLKCIEKRQAEALETLRKRVKVSEEMVEMGLRHYEEKIRPKWEQMNI